jgi:hypothetical protein
MGSFFLRIAMAGHCAITMRSAALPALSASIHAGFGHDMRETRMPIAQARCFYFVNYFHFTFNLPSCLVIAGNDGALACACLKASDAKK